MGVWKKVETGKRGGVDEEMLGGNERKIGEKERDVRVGRKEEIFL